MMSGKHNVIASQYCYSHKSLEQITQGEISKRCKAKLKNSGHTVRHDISKML